MIGLSKARPVVDLAPAAYRRSGDPDNLYRLWFDEESRLVRGEARGIWSLDETSDYLDDLRRFVVETRRLFGKTRLLMDRRQIPSQPTAVAERLSDANGALFQPADRIALVVESSLEKAALRQRMTHGGTQAFLSLSAAETWLRAFA